MAESAAASLKRNVAVSIGVADVGVRGFPFLPGAVNAAKAFHFWAQSLGYQSRLVADETAPVSFARLRFEIEAALAGPDPTPLKPSDGRETIEAALSAATPIRRIVLFFAGHGMIKELEQGLWFLSDSIADKRVVDVEKLRRRLYEFGVDQITIIADACRSLPKKVDLVDMTLDGVLGGGPRASDEAPPIDKFIAAQDGRESYSVPGASTALDRPIFSGVFVEALWGLSAAALRPPENRLVTSQSLKAYLKAEVPRRAALYDRVLKPDISTNFSPGEDVYFGDVPPLNPAPVFSWPDPSEVLGMGGESAEEPDVQPPPPRLPLGVAVHRFWSPARKKGAAKKAARPARPQKPEDAGALTQQREQAALAEIRAQARPESFETQSGFAVAGARIVRVLTQAAIASGDPGAENWVHIGPPPFRTLERPTSLLIELDGGLALAPTALPGFVATLLVDKQGAYALIYRQVHQTTTPLSSEEAVAKLEGGTLDSDQLRDLVVAMRSNSLGDPTLGALSAYFYESLGDIDSLRQTAFYFALPGHPIPFDVAMLGRLPVSARDGRLVATIPATRERRPRTEREARHPWTCAATPASEGFVGGAWPWMRRGWMLLEEYRDRRSALIDPALIEAAKAIAPGRFATLKPEGAALVAERFGLAARKDR